MLQAPVHDAPEARILPKGERISAGPAVNGESIGGSYRWYFVDDTSGPTPLRGFIHSSLVRELP